MGKSIIWITGWLILVTLWSTSCKDKSFEQSSDPEKADTLVLNEPETIYGIALDSFEISNGVVRRNQNLASIFSDLNIPYETVQKIIDSADNIFDFRKVKRGNSYFVFHEPDSLKLARYFVYIDDPIHYYVFDLGDSARVYLKTREISSEFKTVSGVIEYSLWQTILDEGLNPELTNQLSEIYAWTIDFFGLQKGDSFKLIYEEQFVDSSSIGISRIMAAWFSHAGEEFYAIPFRQNGKEDYFDEEGNSLRKAFLKAPLRFSRISSKFSHSRMHPILKIRRPHHGIDYAAPVGTPVHAIGDGKIIEAQYKGQAGRLVKIRHNSTYTTAYLHLSRYGQGIKTGKYVKQGDIIGYVGSSGLSTGPHLDFRFYKNGTPIDPLKVEAPPVEPIIPENMETFSKVASAMIQLLDTVE